MINVGKRATRTTPVAAFVCALAIAGCGGSSKPKTAASGHNQAVAFSQCMRSHGVTGFPDPSSGGGIQIQAGSGVNPASPAFQAAQSSCQKLLPGGGPASGPPSEQVKQQMLALSTCMRAHGVSGFPDPSTGQRPAPGSGYGLVFGRNGDFIAVPNTIGPSSPSFQQAAKACGFGPR
jgi:hypothetical protein